MAGTINVPAVRPPAQDNSGLQLLSSLLDMHLKNKMKQQTETADDTRAYEGVKRFLNPPVEQTIPSNVVEAANAQANIASQPKSNPLADLVVPKQSTVPDNLLQTEPSAPLGTRNEDKMPSAVTQMHVPQPGDDEYVDVPQGLKASDYGMMARSKMNSDLIEGRQAEKPEPVQMFINDKGEIVGVPKKVGPSGIMGKQTVNPFTEFVKSQYELNPNATHTDISNAWNTQRLNEIKARIPSATPTAYPGIYFDRREKAYYDMNQKRVTDPNILIALDAQKRQAEAEAAQRGGPRAMSINAANDLYQQNLPEVVALRWRVAHKSLLNPEQYGELSKFEKIQDWDAAKQWLLTHTGDPETAVLVGKVVLMADNLQKTIGGNQGGEWAFKTAKALLDPTLAPESFEQRMWAHSDDLYALAHSWRSAGTEPVARADQSIRGKGEEMSKNGNTKGYPTPPAKPTVPARDLKSMTTDDLLRELTNGR